MFTNHFILSFRSYKILWPSSQETKSSSRTKKRSDRSGKTVAQSFDVVGNPSGPHQQSYNRGIGASGTYNVCCHCSLYHLLVALLTNFLLSFSCTLQSTMDEGGNFAIPVIEAFPEITDDYLARVQNPLDFRTIQEERLQLYHSIHELQDDLILVFSNCMNYNVPDSDLYLVAQYVLCQPHHRCLRARLWLVDS